VIFRILALATFAGCIGISTYYRRWARRDGETIPRSRESASLKTGRVLVALPLFASILIYLANPRWMGWASVSLPSWARWTGAALGLATVPAAWWVFRSIGRNVSETILTKQDHALVTRGPYRWIRHPLYTTGSALFLSIGLMAANGFILLFALMAVAGIRMIVIPAEEAALLAKFGADYRVYKQRTGRMLPRLRPVRA
jgi:protein-S-isoprenylcysteine O-methyltransferase Ste14